MALLVEQIPLKMARSPPRHGRQAPDRLWALQARQVRQWLRAEVAEDEEAGVQF